MRNTLPSPVTPLSKGELSAPHTQPLLPKVSPGLCHTLPYHTLHRTDRDGRVVGVQGVPGRKRCIPWWVSGIYTMVGSVPYQGIPPMYHPGYPFLGTTLGISPYVPPWVYLPMYHPGHPTVVPPWVSHRCTTRVNTDGYTPPGLTPTVIHHPGIYHRGYQHPGIYHPGYERYPRL